MSTDIAAQQSAVPALYNPAPLEIDGSDIALPRIYVGQSNSKAVEADLVMKGSIYSATSGDDTDPIVLFDPKGKDKKGVLVHVLSMTKGRSATIDGELQRYAFNDPDAPPESWVTYNYVVCLPEVDEDVPYKLLFTKTSTPTAKKINTILKKNQDRGPAHACAFRLTTVSRSNAKGTWFVLDAKPADATPEQIAVAGSMAEMVGSAPAAPSAPVSEPAI